MFDKLGDDKIRRRRGPMLMLGQSILLLIWSSALEHQNCKDPTVFEVRVF